MLVWNPRTRAVGKVVPVRMEVIFWADFCDTNRHKIGEEMNFYLYIENFIYGQIAEKLSILLKFLL